jgi:hypothetical protein
MTEIDLNKTDHQTYTFSLNFDVRSGTLTVVAQSPEVWNEVWDYYLMLRQNGEVLYGERRRKGRRGPDYRELEPYRPCTALEVPYAIRQGLLGTLQRTVTMIGAAIASQSGSLNRTEEAPRLLAEATYREIWQLRVTQNQYGRIDGVAQRNNGGQLDTEGIDNWQGAHDVLVYLKRCVDHAMAWERSHPYVPIYPKP